MDTRFWGPYGWDFLHTLPYSYDSSCNKERNAMKGFLKLLGEMLPCIYCRRSYKQYYEEMPVDSHLDTQNSLARWMYQIHNKVNGKLRSQGLLKTPDPSFPCIQKSNLYKYNKSIGEREVPGIDFIYIIAFHYRNTTIQNKRNKYERFFRYLARIIHLKDIRICLQKKMKDGSFGSGRGMYCWWDNIYRSCDLKCNVCVQKCRNRCFANISGCKKKNHRGKTCRKLRTKRTKTLKRKIIRKN